MLVLLYNFGRLFDHAGMTKIDTCRSKPRFPALSAARSYTDDVRLHDVGARVVHTARICHIMTRKVATSNYHGRFLVPATREEDVRRPIRHTTTIWCSSNVFDFDCSSNTT